MSHLAVMMSTSMDCSSTCAHVLLLSVMDTECTLISVGRPSRCVETKKIASMKRAM